MSPYMGGLSKGLGGLGKLSKGLASFPAIGKGLGGFPRRMAAAVAAVFTPGKAEGVDFDGVNDYLSRSSDLIGNADGKTFTFSCWVWADNTTSYGEIYAADTWFYVAIVLSSGAFQVSIEGTNAAGSQVLLCSLSSGLVAKDSFCNILVSIDLTNRLNRHMYVNDVVQSPSWTTYINSAIDFTRSAHGISATGGSANKLKGRLSHIYLDYQYRDLSIEANRRLFITSDRKPVPNQAALSPILYLPMRSPETCHINEGTGGDFVLNGVVARSGRGPNQFNAPYSDLNGTSQYLSRAGFAGVTDGSALTVHMAVNITSFASYSRVFSSTNGANYTLSIDINNSSISITARNSAAEGVLSVTSSVDPVAGRNYVITASFDLTSTSKRWLYINGVADSPEWRVYTNSLFDLTATGWAVGCDAQDLSHKLIGRLGNLYFDTKYIDLSIPANLAKFCAGTGIDCKPVDMGANGELPTGTPPLIYLPMYGNNAGKNYGTGGDFTVNGGPFPGARGPNEYWGNKLDFDGTTSYAYRASALDGVSDSKTISFVFSFIADSLANYKRIFHSTYGESIEFYFYGNKLNFTSDCYTAAHSLTLVTGTKYIVFLSIDANDPNKKAFVINDNATATWDSYSNQTLTLSSTLRYYFGGSFTGAVVENFFDGKLSEFYFATDYIDFSQESNRLKFMDAFGNPTDLPAVIESVEVPKPAIYLRFPPDNPGKNSGYGGDFNPVAYIDGGQL